MKRFLSVLLAVGLWGVAPASIALVATPAYAAKPASGTPVNGGQALSANLTAAWGMLENSGTTTADGTGNGHTLTFGAGEAWGTSGADVAITFSGADASPLAVTSPITLAGTGSWSVAWRGHTTAGGTAGMVLGDNTVISDFIWFQGGTALKFRSTGGTDYGFSPTVFTADANYVLSYDQPAARLHLYKDGSEVAGSPFTITTNDAGLKINTVGNGYTSNTFSLAGTLTYAYVWSGRALSLADAGTLNTDPYTPYRSSSSFTISETVLPSNHGAGTVVVHAVGTGTSWTSGTAWTASGVTGWSFGSKTFVDATHYTLTLNEPASATPPAGATGTLTVTDTTDTLNATTTVATPTVSISPTSGATGTTPTLTLTGGNTLWTTETAAGLFTVTGGTGASIGTPTVTTNTAATDVLTVGTGAGALTVKDTSTGATATFTATGGGITITSPVANQFRWRGTGGTASLTISGTYTGSPTSIQWSSDNVNFNTLVASPVGGTYSGSVSLATGQYTITTRFSNVTTTTASVTPVSIAYVFVIAGQSNASGRGTNNQAYFDPSGITHGLKTATGYAALADPYASTIDAGSTGSFVPPMVTDLAALLKAPIGIVPTSQGGTSITVWQSGGGNYAAMKSAALAVGGCNAVLWWQGETDALASMSQATYHTNLASFVASVQTDLACPVIPCTLQNFSNATSGQQGAINAAIIAGWTDITGAKTGPDLRPIPTQPEDTLHLKTDQKLGAAGSLWAGAIYKALFQPAGGGGLIPGPSPFIRPSIKLPLRRRAA